MEEKDQNLPKELCSLGFVLWVSFSLLSYYPVLRETYNGPFPAKYPFRERTRTV